MCRMGLSAESYVPPRFARGERNYTKEKFGLGEKVTTPKKDWDSGRT